MQVLKEKRVDYIVAPYEADAQMTFLSVNKVVDAVIVRGREWIAVQWIVCIAYGGVLL
jgi:exonuclease 1